MAITNDKLLELVEKLKKTQVYYKNKTKIADNVIHDFFVIMERFINEKPDFFEIVAKTVKESLDFGSYDRDSAKSAKFIANFHILFEKSILNLETSFSAFDRQLLRKDIINILPSSNQIAILGRACLNAVKDQQTTVHRYLDPPNATSRTVDLIKICNDEFKRNVSPNPEVSRDAVINHLLVFSEKGNSVYKINVERNNGGKGEFKKADINFMFEEASRIVEDCQEDEISIGMVLYGLSLSIIEESGIFQLPIFVACSIGAAVVISKEFTREFDHKEVPENVLLELAFFFGSHYLSQFSLPFDERDMKGRIKKGHEHAKTVSLLNYNLMLNIDNIGDILKNFIDVVEEKISSEMRARVQV